MLFSHASAGEYGTLLFSDTFDRTESQELKDEPGNEWTTSSEKTAKGHKEVDLRDGHVYLYTHAEANHATSFRHAFEFQDGTLGLRFMFDDADDELTLNFADLELKSVSPGSFFKFAKNRESFGYSFPFGFAGGRGFGSTDTGLKVSRSGSDVSTPFCGTSRSATFPISCESQKSVVVPLLIGNRFLAAQPPRWGFSDQASAALVMDLKQRGMLDDTLVVWGGEFGRTVYCQGRLTADDYGRDHHPRCFTIWLAGGGIKPGFTYGTTDDFSYNILDKPVYIHDLHATMLHQLGIDHTQLTYKFQGRHYRLTDVHGNVVREILV